MRSSFLEDHPLVCACPEPPRLVDNQTRAFSLIPTPTLTTVFFARCQETPDNELGGVWALFLSTTKGGYVEHLIQELTGLKLDESMYQEMQRSKIFEVEHKLFLDLIHPSFEGVDNMEDMAAIIARTHI